MGVEADESVPVGVLVEMTVSVGPTVAVVPVPEDEGEDAPLVEDELDVGAPSRVTLHQYQREHERHNERDTQNKA